MKFSERLQFDECSCKQFGTLALQNPSEDAYDSSASTIVKIKHTNKSAKQHARKLQTLKKKLDLTVFAKNEN